MSESLIQMLATGLVGALLAMELCLAIASWFEAGGGAASNAPRDQVRPRRERRSSVRGELREVRLPDHRRRVRDAVKRLQPTPYAASVVGCLDCRGSRLRGLARCPGCARRLVAPAAAA